jgi:hypothetical protein
MSGIDEKLNTYLTLNKELNELRKQQKTYKKKIDEIEKNIKEYMKENEMDSISLKDGQIVLYPRKISQTFKKEVIMERLTEELKDTNKAEALTQSILSNKKFTVEDRLKAVIKKK